MVTVRMYYPIWNNLIEGWSSFFWFLTHVSLDNLHVTVARIEVEAGFLKRTLSLFILLIVVLHDISR